MSDDAVREADGFITWLCEQIANFTDEQLIADVTRYPDTAVENLRRLAHAIKGDKALEDARAAANIANGTTRKLLDRVSVLEGELHDFATWADSYPTSVWHEPDSDALKAAHEALKAAGLGGIDALSAMVYRHALTHISERARAALAPQSTTAEEEAR